MARTRGARRQRQRSDAEELAKRHALVRAALIDGETHADIKTRLAKKFACDERQVARYIERVTKDMLDDGTDLPSSMLHRLYQQAVRDGKFTAAAGLLKRIEDRASRDGSLAKSLKALGPPPLDDPLALQAWGQKVQAVELWVALQDPTLAPTERRALVVKLNRGINASTPHAELYDIRQKLLALSKRQADPSQARELEDAPVVGTGPLRAATARGRRGRRTLRPPEA